MEDPQRNYIDGLPISTKSLGGRCQQEEEKKTLRVIPPPRRRLASTCKSRDPTAPCTEEKKRQKQLDFFDDLESSADSPSRFFKSWWGHARSTTAHRLPLAVVNHSGEAITDSVDVLKTWKVFAESLGKDTLEHPDCGDHGELQHHQPI